MSVWYRLIQNSAQFAFAEPATFSHSGDLQTPAAHMAKTTMRPSVTDPTTNRIRARSIFMEPPPIRFLLCWPPQHRAQLSSEQREDETDIDHAADDGEDRQRGLVAQMRQRCAEPHDRTVGDP